ncbi:MAG: AAA family ATPase [bacterium]|nr:AAA family ATPase [bacterium]
METMKQIMYGVTDFARIRAENGYFVDRTALIRELEKTSYAMFLRPRRFGKSLLCSILQCYYDIDYAGRFEEFFGGLDIGREPTAERGKYLFIDFNFTGVEKRIDRVQDSFNEYCSERLDVFVERQAGRLPEGTTAAVLAKRTCHEKFNTLTMRLKGSGLALYITIDEYDNFTNTILAESRESYEALCHGDGFFKQFFNELKLATTGTDAPVTRLFVTGVTPVTMDDVTSGFNIAANISLNPAFAALTGFTHGDVRAMLAYYRAHAGFAFDEAAVFETMRRWYDGYRFSPETGADGKEPPRVANPTLVLYYMQYFLQNHRPQPDLVDENLRTDYMKIRHVITEGRRINGNFHRLEDLIARLGATATLRKSFQARELGVADNFVSFLFYNGLVTVTGEDLGQSRLGIPNLTVGEFLHDFVPKAYQDLNGIDPRLFDVANAMTDFARHGDWRAPLETAASVVSRYWRVRDAVEGERVVQTALCALLYVGHGPYIVRHERESAGGFVDIAFEPQLARWPEIGHAALVELKCLKASDDASPAALAKIRDAAAAQLARYAADHDLARAWNLKEQGGMVTLHRVVLVFHGGDVALCEEV